MSIKDLGLAVNQYYLTGVFPALITPAIYTEFMTESK